MAPSLPTPPVFSLALSILLLLTLRVALFGHLLSATAVRLRLQGADQQKALRACKLWSLGAGVAYLGAAVLIAHRIGGLAALTLAWAVHLGLTAVVWRDEHREGWCFAKDRPEARAEDLKGKLFDEPVQTAKSLWALSVLFACGLWLQPASYTPSQWLALWLSRVL